MHLFQRPAEPAREPSDSVPPLSAHRRPLDSRPPQSSRVAVIVMTTIGLGALAGAVAWKRAHAPATQATRAAEAPVAAEPPRAEPQMVTAPAPPKVAAEEDPEPQTLDDQLERLFGKLRAELWLSDAQMSRVEAIFAASPVLSQGNPVISKHPISRAECQQTRADAGLPRSYTDARCGAPNMVPIYDPGAGETAASAKVCIDQFEFPDIPCEYPVVHVRANEAAEICAAVGKRLCDAHEWEGACAGAVHDASTEYEWPRPRMEAEFWHNKNREQVWSYGPEKNHALCGTMSDRTPDCPGGGWNKCGSNTYPAGAFLECKSSFGAYDFHGNAAEHMSLPLGPEELRMQNGGGVTEMKGSWFVFGKIQAHADDCRWRAPSWHESRVMNDNSHRNYHLGFRCCKDVE
ncbi:Hypothetical protein A7982_05959 [Minicystis rosea]|nr:Hypothetical protein A7982_05959 [Minicystis rosea]